MTFKDEIPVGRAEDLRGQKFGKLTVLYRVQAPTYGTYWKCKCDCGNTIIVRRDHLKKEEVKSCNQCKPKKYENLIGQRFGRLIVLQDTYKKSSTGTEIWKCKCDCGNEVEVRSDNLKSGNTKSCGCYQKDRAYEVNTINIPKGSKYGMLTVIKEVEKDDYNRRCFLCKCDCGNLIVVNITALGKTRFSCGCITSIGQAKIIKILNDNNILFEIEKTFNNFRYKDTNGIPRFDFFINNSYLLEYDGNIHFKQNIKENSWNTTKEYLKRHNNDLQKNEYCKKYGIPLIRIPYTKLDTLCLEDLLLETTEFRVA